MRKVLDLFSGYEGWSRPFRHHGWSVVTLDFDPRFGADIQKDIHDFTANDLPRGWYPDVILASPPCNGMSVMNIGRNWTHDHQPKTEAARQGLAMLERTIFVIEALDPKFFVIENPRCKTRKLPPVQHLERRTVTWCQYGDRRMKPTDLWGGFPPSLKLKPPCKNGDPCHLSAPRGSTTGTQGMDPALAARIPYALSMEILNAVERDL